MIIEWLPEINIDEINKKIEADKELDFVNEISRRIENYKKINIFYKESNSNLIFWNEKCDYRIM